VSSPRRKRRIGVRCRQNLFGAERAGDLPGVQAMCYLLGLEISIAGGAGKRVREEGGQESAARESGERLHVLILVSC